MKNLFTALMAAFVGGCATLAPQFSNGPPPRFEEPKPLPAGDPGVALVLSGGAARGYAHVGVIRVLEAHGLRPSIVVGSSAGSMVGALYASGLSAAQVERALGELGQGTFNDFVMPAVGFFPGEMGLIKGDRLHRFIDDRAATHAIENFPMRFAAVATDLATGRVEIFNAGDAGAAVRASASVPGVMVPAEIAGRVYADGQIASPVPVDAARRLGARTVIAVDVIYPPRDSVIRSALGVLFKSVLISAYRLKQFELAHADEVIVPDLPRTEGQMSFHDRERLTLAGERAALDALDRIRPYFLPTPAIPARAER